jgi:hypothetical protein
VVDEAEELLLRRELRLVCEDDGERVRVDDAEE